MRESSGGFYDNLILISLSLNSYSGFDFFLSFFQGTYMLYPTTTQVLMLVLVRVLILVLVQILVAVTIAVAIAIAVVVAVIVVVGGGVGDEGL